MAAARKTAGAEFTLRLPETERLTEAPPVGSRVSVWWGRDATWYPAQVVYVQGQSTLRVEYEDGDTRGTNLTLVRVQRSQRDALHHTVTSRQGTTYVWRRMRCPRDPRLR